MSEFFPGWLSFNSGSSEAADALVARADDDEDEDEDEDEDDRDEDEDEDEENEDGDDGYSE
jgi:hypothetical protein